MKTLLKLNKHNFTLNKYLFISLIALVLFPFGDASAFPTTYVIEQLTDNDYYDGHLKINDNGQVAWMGCNAPGQSHCQIWFYDGSTKRNISSNNYGNYYPQINDSGHVVWQGPDGGFEIWLYDGNNVSQISSNVNDDYGPQINAGGQVVWFGLEIWSELNRFDWGIWLYDGDIPRKISSNNYYYDYRPQINDNGRVVWSGGDGNDMEIWLYDGNSPGNISSNNYDNHEPQINENGQVTWRGWDGNDWEIWLYDGNIKSNISSNIYDTQNPQIDEGGRHVLLDDRDSQINDSAKVVWSGWDGNDMEIWLYDGNTKRNISSNDHDDRVPQINNSGKVVWNRWNGGIWLYDGNEVREISSTDYPDQSPQINDSGQVAWYGWDGNDWEIYLANPHINYGYLDGVRPDFNSYWQDLPFRRYTLCERYPQLCPPFPPLYPYDRGPDLPDPRYTEAFRDPIFLYKSSFSNSWRPAGVPSSLTSLFRTVEAIFPQSGEFKWDQKLQKQLTTSLEGITIGERFTKKLQESAMEALKMPPNSRIMEPRSLHHLWSAVNAADLDWRVPFLNPVEVKRGKNRRGDFKGVANVTFENLEQNQKISLLVDNSVPAFAKGFSPGWPRASYRFDYEGVLEDKAEVSIYFGGYDFKVPHSSLRLLQWDGKSFQDITTIVDLPNKTIRGSTKNLSRPLVIMGAVEEKEKKL